MTNGTKRERGTGRIFLRGKTWWAQYYDRGRQIRESTGEVDERKASTFLRKRIGKVEAGIVPDSRSIRYEDLRDAYLADCEMNELKSLRRDANGKVYIESVRRMDKFFEGRKAVDVNVDLMRKFQAEMKAAGFANGSINRSLASLRRMFTLAQRDEKLGHLPFFPMLPEAKPRRGTLEHAKYEALVKEMPAYIRLPIIIAFHTGMRRGEILALTWKNIKWMDRVIEIEDSKNGDLRLIPFSDEMEIALKEQFAKRQHECERVCFRVDRRGHARPVGNFRKPWYRVCVKLGLGEMEPKVDSAGNPVFARQRYEHSKPKQAMEYTGLKLHDLRRTFITDAENAGAARHEAMAMSGHRQESVYKRYAIENLDPRRAALAKIESHRAQKLRDISGTDSTNVVHSSKLTN